MDVVGACSRVQCKQLRATQPLPARCPPPPRLPAGQAGQRDAVPAVRDRCACVAACRLARRHCFLLQSFFQRRLLHPPLTQPHGCITLSLACPCAAPPPHTHNDAVTSREEDFYDLSLEIDQNCSLTSCLRNFRCCHSLCGTRLPAPCMQPAPPRVGFAGSCVQSAWLPAGCCARCIDSAPFHVPLYRSSTETLDAEDKFFCDKCGCLQEAQVRFLWWVVGCGRWANCVEGDRPACGAQSRRAVRSVLTPAAATPSACRNACGWRSCRRCSACTSSASST